MYEYISFLIFACLYKHSNPSKIIFSMSTFTLTFLHFINPSRIGYLFPGCSVATIVTFSHLCSFLSFLCSLLNILMLSAVILKQYYILATLYASWDISKTNASVQSPNFVTFMEPGNRFQGMNSASLCSLAGLYDNLYSYTRFLAPIDCLTNSSSVGPVR